MRRHHLSAWPLFAILLWGLSWSSPLQAQPAPPAFPHLAPIHADGSPAARVSPIVEKKAPLEAAPPSMGYYETRWRRWDAVVMPRLPEKKQRSAPPAEPIPLPDQPLDEPMPEPPGESLPPLGLPPLVPEANGNDGNGGIRFLPGDRNGSPSGQGTPTPAEQPGDTDVEDLEDLFREPEKSESSRRPQPIEPPRDGNPFEDDPQPIPADDLFPDLPADDMDEEEDDDVDLDELFDSSPTGSQSSLPKWRVPRELTLLSKELSTPIQEADYFVQQPNPVRPAIPTHPWQQAHEASRVVYWQSAPPAPSVAPSQSVPKNRQIAPEWSRPLRSSQPFEGQRAHRPISMP